MKRFIYLDELPYKTFSIEIDVEKSIAKCFTNNGELIELDVEFNDESNYENEEEEDHDLR